MHSLIMALVLLGTLIADAARPHYNVSDAVCCVQDEWEGFMYMDYSSVFIDADTVAFYMNGTIHIAYSYNQQKMYLAVTETERSQIVPKPQSGISTILYDYAMGRQYTVTNGQCQKGELDPSMPRQCIPGGATRLSSASFGNGGPAVDTYQFLTTSDISWFVTATVHKIGPAASTGSTRCDPVRVSYHVPSAEKGSGTIYNIDVTDIGPIVSTGVFNIPKQCL